MRSMILSAVLLLAACGQPHQRAATKEEPEAFTAWQLFQSNDPMIVAPKCLALLQRSELAEEPATKALSKDWRDWYERSGATPGMMSQMISLNSDAYSATPIKSVRAGVDFCARKMSEIRPAAADADARPTG